MELALSLGDTPKPFSFLENSSQKIVIAKDLGFCMAAVSKDGAYNGSRGGDKIAAFDGQKGDSSSDPPVQLDLLPFSPVHRSLQPSSNKFPFPWLREKLVVSEPGRGTDVNRRGEETEEGSSPNSAVSSFPVDFSIFRAGKRDFTAGINEGHEMDMGFSSRGSDDEGNGMARKKLRLTKEQSAFLEDSFKEHNTLNPKQKLALAKQLNLRRRQVEVWFQNRRARTKLKQTEVDCESLKRCRETLSEENKRLQKEVQELKASQPFYRQLPATTLSMCPSCEKVSTTGNGVTNINTFSVSPSNGHVQQAAS